MNCENCNTVISGLSDTCGHCGFPYNGTHKEKQIFLGKQQFLQGQLEETETKLKKASLMLYVIGGFNIINGFLVFMKQDSMLDLIIYSFVGISLLCFGFFLKKNPVLFISVALFLITAVYALQVISNGKEILYHGIVFKVITYVLLITAMVSAIEAAKIKKENKTLA